MSGRTGLPLMVRLVNGATLTLVSKLGNVSVGLSDPGARKGVLSGPRPRFLARSRQGRLSMRFRSTHRLRAKLGLIETQKAIQSKRREKHQPGIAVGAKQAK